MNKSVGEILTVSRLFAAIVLAACTYAWAEPGGDDERTLIDKDSLLVLAPYDLSSPKGKAEVPSTETKNGFLTLSLTSTLNGGPQESTSLYPDELKVLPVAIYVDSNLFGGAWNMTAISAVIYNDVELSRKEIGNTVFDVAFGAAGMFLPEEYLFSYDDHRYAIESLTLRSRYLLGRFAAGYSIRPGARLALSYAVRKDWYVRSAETSDALTFPDDLLHSMRLGLELGMLHHVGPAGIVPVGLRLAAEVGYEYFQSFREWGAVGFRNAAPYDGLGTAKYSFETQYGTSFLKRASAAFALGVFGGANYYTRTFYRLGSPGPADASALFLRGYRSREFEVETAVVGHLDAGYELSMGNTHLGLFSDIAFVQPARGAIGPWRSLYSAGLGLSAVLPWELLARLEYAHGLVDLTGSLAHGHDSFNIALTRSFRL